MLKWRRSQSLRGYGEMLRPDDGLPTSVQSLQENTFNATYDYRAGSPHLAHYQLYEPLVSQVLRRFQLLARRGLDPTVLEIGAGHGGYTEPVLAAGGEVTATEMSRASLARLEARFGSNEDFRGAFDTDGSLAVLGDDQFSMVLCASVLHHIPDYLGFVRHVVSRHLTAGGTFLSFQDPLWYASVPRTTRLFDRFAYFSWRATRGNYRTGASTLLRRLRGVYDQSNPADMVEYHVVRDGVDQEALAAMLSTEFEEVEIATYWSTPATVWQRAGHCAGLRNTFMLAGHGRLGERCPDLST